MRVNDLALLRPASRDYGAAGELVILSTALNRLQSKTPARRPAFRNPVLPLDLVAAIASIVAVIAPVISAVVVPIAPSIVTVTVRMVAAMFSADVASVNPMTP